MEMDDTVAEGRAQQSGSAVVEGSPPVSPVMGWHVAEIAPQLVTGYPVSDVTRPGPEGRGEGDQQQTCCGSKRLGKMRQGFLVCGLVMATLVMMAIGVAVKLGAMYAVPQDEHWAASAYSDCGNTWGFADCGTKFCSSAHDDACSRSPLGSFMGFEDAKACELYFADLPDDSGSGALSAGCQAVTCWSRDRRCPVIRCSDAEMNHPEGPECKTSNYTRCQRYCPNML